MLISATLPIGPMPLQALFYRVTKPALTPALCSSARSTGRNRYHFASKPEHLLAEHQRLLIRNGDAVLRVTGNLAVDEAGGAEGSQGRIVPYQQTSQIGDASITVRGRQRQ